MYKLLPIRIGIIESERTHLESFEMVVFYEIKISKSLHK